LARLVLGKLSADVSGCYTLSQPHRTQGRGASGALSLSAIADHRTSGRRSRSMLIPT